MEARDVAEVKPAEPDPPRPAEAEPAPVERFLEPELESAYDENGVDRSLIRWNLQQSPTDRVKAVEETLSALSTLRRIETPP